jgi:ribosomal protein S18 acetylase RimI-like enzyme
MVGIEALPLGRHQIHEAGEALGRAFFDDPVFLWAIPDNAKRERVLPWLLGISVRYGNLYGEVHTTPGKAEGAAVWLPPGSTDMPLWRMIRAGFLAALLKLGLAELNRLNNANNYLDKLHKRDMPGTHWFLMTLGVDPARQGQGVGGALIRPVLARADADGLPCYLETSKERNLLFYQSHGFEILREVDIPNGGPRTWTMKRKPAGASAG